MNRGGPARPGEAAPIRPFAGIRPAAGRAAEVVAPPYDVLSAAEARAQADGRPWSFLRLSRPEVGLAPDARPAPDELYRLAADTMRRMFAAGVLRRDPAPRYYVYRMAQDGHSQTGLVAAVPVAAYEAGRIRRHETTRPDKQADRARQIEAMGAQTSPVMLIHRDDRERDAAIAEAAGSAPAIEATTGDGVRHALWAVAGAAEIDRIDRAFAAPDALYIADGHHRCAAAAAARADAILAAIFPAREMRIHAYDRIVRDLGGRDAAAILAEVGARFAVRPEAAPVRPARQGEFGMYLAGAWYRLRARDRTPAEPAEAAAPDAGLLGDRLLAPVFGIADPRRDARLDFVAGADGPGELQRRVDSGRAAAAFSLRPVRLAELFAVADAGATMPPKSTWFAPKLADGLVSCPLDRAPPLASDARSQ